MRYVLHPVHHRAVDAIMPRPRCIDRPPGSTEKQKHDEFIGVGKTTRVVRWDALVSRRCGADSLVRHRSDSRSDEVKLRSGLDERERNVRQRSDAVW